MVPITWMLLLSVSLAMPPTESPFDVAARAYRPPRDPQWNRWISSPLPAPYRVPRHVGLDDGTHLPEGGLPWCARSAQRALRCLAAVFHEPIDGLPARVSAVSRAIRSSPGANAKAMEVAVLFQVHFDAERRIDSIREVIAWDPGVPAISSHILRYIALDQKLTLTSDIAAWCVSRRSNLLDVEVAWYLDRQLFHWLPAGADRESELRRLERVGEELGCDAAERRRAESPLPSGTVSFVGSDCTAFRIWVDEQRRPPMDAP